MGKAWSNQTGIMVMLVVLLQPLVAGPQQTDEARAIMRRVIKQASADDEVVDIAMQLINENGRVRRRTATLYSKKRQGDDDMRLIRFHTPADLAKSGVLTLEDSARDPQQWLYLPAYHTSRRIASANRSNTWMGTDFAYEDITDPKIEHYQYRILGQEHVHGTPYTVIEALPIEAKLQRESGYSKLIYWIDTEKDITLQVEYYDKSGALLKRLTNAEPERFGKHYRWQRWEMHHVQRHHRTLLEFSNRRMNQGVSKRYFTVRYLERGR